ncbi:mechanosensitive ion channel family protein [Bacillus sp. V3B]|uniref:mechanosensitive ion channel family protein n=1 Tax=Bacillus sp. V3B TaxID=2804915 RepID=UPI00210AC319|nr:mechanosensitive ion channel family protein [Bacillus sp. V3B]MCQ6276812.1 mechanosensitive ion channel family protein [Bacillus sp. V3B]
MSWELFFAYEHLIDLGIAVAIFLLFLLFRKIFAKYVFTLLLKLSSKAPTTLFSSVFKAYERPIQWLFIIIGFYVAVRYYPLLNHSNTLFLDILRSGVIIVISSGLYNLSASSSAIFAKLNDKYSLEIDAILLPFLSKVLRVVIVAIAISVIAQEFGYNVSSLVAGLGIGGLAVSLAAKDALANLFGGFVIITEKPFSIGEWIKTSAVEGTVEEITFRSTRIRTFADAIVTVPNATLANDSITNWSKMGKRQITFNLKVTYDTPRDKLENVVREIKDKVKNHPGIHPETIFVTFDQYQENGYGIFLYFFTNTTAWGEFLSIKEEINFKIVDILEQEGVSLAIPSRKLYVDQENDVQLKKDVLGRQEA